MICVEKKSGDAYCLPHQSAIPVRSILGFKFTTNENDIVNTANYVLFKNDEHGTIIVSSGTPSNGGSVVIKDTTVRVNYDSSEVFKIYSKDGAKLNFDAAKLSPTEFYSTRLCRSAHFQYEHMHLGKDYVIGFTSSIPLPILDECDGAYFEKGVLRGLEGFTAEVPNALPCPATKKGFFALAMNSKREASTIFCDTGDKVACFSSNAIKDAYEKLARGTSTSLEGVGLAPRGEQLVLNDEQTLYFIHEFAEGRVTTDDVTIFYNEDNLSDCFVNAIADFESDSLVRASGYAASGDTLSLVIEGYHAYLEALMTDTKRNILTTVKNCRKAILREFRDADLFSNYEEPSVSVDVKLATMLNKLLRRLLINALGDSSSDDPNSAIISIFTNISNIIDENFSLIPTWKSVVLDCFRSVIEDVEGKVVALDDVVTSLPLIQLPEGLGSETESVSHVYHRWDGCCGGFVEANGPTLAVMREHHPIFDVEGELKWQTLLSCGNEVYAEIDENGTKHNKIRACANGQRDAAVRCEVLSIDTSKAGSGISGILTQPITFRLKVRPFEVFSTEANLSTYIQYCKAIAIGCVSSAGFTVLPKEGAAESSAVGKYDAYASGLKYDLHSKYGIVVYSRKISVEGYDRYYNDLRELDHSTLADVEVRSNKNRTNFKPPIQEAPEVTIILKAQLGEAYSMDELQKLGFSDEIADMLSEIYSSVHLQAANYLVELLKTAGISTRINGFIHTPFGFLSPLEAAKFCGSLVTQDDCESIIRTILSAIDSVNASDVEVDDKNLLIEQLQTVLQIFLDNLNVSYEKAGDKVVIKQKGLSRIYTYDFPDQNTVTPAFSCFSLGVGV